jgi:transmembrane sensor
MTLQPPRRLARFVEPDVDDKRVDRVWSSIASRPVRSWPVWRMTAFAGAVVIAAVLAVLLRPRQRASDLAGVVIESGTAQVVTMPDGTSVTLRSGARLRYDRVQGDRVETTVERGEVVFDVRHTDSRVFVVHAAAFDVVDRGTRFVVGVDGDRVSVSVESGSVEIARSQGAEPKRTLAAGESWTSAGPSATVLPAATSAGTVDSPDNPPPPEPSDRAPSTSPTDGARGPSSPSPGPRELLQAANEARLAGHPREAAAAFDTLRRRYRGDPRAALAAFELGRLRLDALGDPSGAAEALADSIALAPGATFREDAEARLVEALERAHDTGRCGAARRAYLARFPGGLHAASVAARCP